MEISNNFILFKQVDKFYYYSSKKILQEKNIMRIENLNKSINIFTHSSQIRDRYLAMNQYNSLYDLDNDMSYTRFKIMIPTDYLHWNTLKLDLMIYNSLSQKLILKYFLNKKTKIFNPDKFSLVITDTYFIRKISAIISFYSREKFEQIDDNIVKILKNYPMQSKTSLYVFLQQIINGENTERTTLIYEYYQKEKIPDIDILNLYLVNEKQIIQLIDNMLVTLDQYNIEDNKIILIKVLENQYTKYIFTDLYQIELWESNSMRRFKDLSTGEIDLVLLLSLLYEEIKIGKLNLILLDEIEAFFHPQWSKQMLNILINEIKKDNIYLIFTTHSPFLLSDIPKQNIIFLDKDENGNCKVVDGLKEKKQTFGANIHTLLSDSFFMEDGLMGEFAKGKINEIIEFHKEVEEENSDKEALKIKYLENQKKFWQTQKIIGEEYLKQVIRNHLVEIEKILLGKDKAKEEEITRTKEYLKSLEND
jgi:ABC-type multidrug transport system ATPase subunit